jgi:hypothetical protein
MWIEAQLVGANIAANYYLAVDSFILKQGPCME